MILYHFSTSPFARRVRLTLALKGLSAELRDARANPEYGVEVRRLNPLGTVPVLVADDRVLTESSAICHYIDRLVPEPPLWPAGMAGAEAFDYVAVTDSVLSLLIDLGLRFSALHDHERFPAVRAELVGRAQRGLEHLGERVAARGTGALCGGQWSGADISLFTAVTWLEGIPARAATAPTAKKLLDLGWSLPAALSAWADQHRDRPDVLALG